MTDVEEKAEKTSAATQLVQMALEQYHLHVTAAGDAFAVPRTGSSHIARRIRGGRLSMRAELARRYFQTMARTAPQQALADATLVIEGMAQDQEAEVLHLRVAEHSARLWVDIADADSRAICIENDRWTVLDSAPVLFQRTELTAPYPLPVRGGSLDELRRFVRVSDEDWPVLVALLAAAFQPDLPHPVMAWVGEQGTGKSSATRCVIDLIDPSPVPLRKAPKDPEAWITAAAGSWAVAVDNISGVPDWFSDALCRAVTGDGDVRRQLYTDGGLSVFSFRRVVLLTGIDLGTLRGDLAERLALLELHRIPDDQRVDERTLARDWQDARPRIFGALLDIVAAVYALLPTIRLVSAPRMADFAKTLAAVDQILGTDGLARYRNQARTMAADTLAGSPFTTLLMTSLTDFEGTAAELLDAVTPPPDSAWRPPRDWPRNPRAVTTLLRRDAPALRKQGWAVDDLGAGGHAKVTVWAIASPDGGRQPPPPAPHDPHEEAQRGERGAAGNDPALPLTNQREEAGAVSALPLATHCRICGQSLWAPISRASGLCGKTDDSHRAARRAPEREGAA